MSVQQLAAVFERSESRNGARLVLLSIANHDGDGGSWPSIATIAAEANLSEKSVHRAIQELEALGEVERSVNRGGTVETRPDHRPNRYIITLKRGGQVGGAVEGNGVDNLSERGGQVVPNGVDNMGGRTVLEPSKEPSVRAEADATFPAFWELYPRKAAKRSALQAYERALKRARPHASERIIDAARRYAKSVEKTEERFIRHATTWLNGDCWDDEHRLKGHRPLNDFPEEV